MENNRKNLEKILIRMRNIFRRLDKSFFLLHGTLLGYHRDKRLIGWDDDIDLGCLEDFNDKEFRQNLMKLLVDSGFQPQIRETNEWPGACNIAMITGYPYVIPTHGDLKTNLNTERKLEIGLKFVKQVANVYIESSSDVVYPIETITPLKQVEFLGDKFHIPNSPEPLFDLWYGKDCWHTPSRRLWIIKPREKASNKEPIVPYHDQKMGYRARGIIEALLECDNKGNFIRPFRMVGRTPR